MKTIWHVWKLFICKNRSQFTFISINSDEAASKLFPTSSTSTWRKRRTEQTPRYLHHGTGSETRMRNPKLELILTAKQHAKISSAQKKEWG